MKEKKNKLTKEAKKEAKLQKKAEGKTSLSPQTKNTIIKAVTAVICAAAICISAASAVGKYTDALVEAANTSANPSSSSEGESAETAGEAPYENKEPHIISYGDEAPADESAASEETTEAPAADENKTDSAPEAAKSEKSNDLTKFSKTQVVKYYNDCLKKTYNLPKLTIKKVEDIKIVIDDVNPGGDGVVNLGNKIINKYAKATEFTDSFANGKSASGGDDAQEFSFHANLDPAGAKTATIKKSGNGYEINITVVSEKATLEKRPVYNSQCANPLDLGAVDLFGLKVTQADFNYPATTLKAVVDPEGRVTSAVSYMPMNGSGAGKLIISGGATVHGSMTKSATFTF